MSKLPVAACAGAVVASSTPAALIGGDADPRPTDPDGFLAFGRRLRSPELYEAIAGAEPETERILGFRQTANHLDKALRRPGADSQKAVACAANAACVLSTNGDSRSPDTKGARRGLPPGWRTGTSTGSWRSRTGIRTSATCSLP
jgi:hypothetical protein